MKLAYLLALTTHLMQPTDLHLGQSYQLWLLFRQRAQRMPLSHVSAVVVPIVGISMSMGITLLM